MAAIARAEHVRRASYGNVFDGNPSWNAIPVAERRDLYAWDARLHLHPGAAVLPGPRAGTRAGQPTSAARACWRCWATRSPPTTSRPPGDIAASSPAGRFLSARGVEKKDFNSYGARRGNDQVMVRGTFANIRLRNLLVPGIEGGVTIHLPTGEQMAIYDAAERYQAEGTPLVVLAGKEYGTGSSRDWAAKGTLLLGVRAVHRRELTSASTARTWSAWACCRCSSRRARAPSRSG